MKRAPRIAAIQDLSGFGRCSTTVVLPVLSAMGSQCCPMLTAYLSAHTAFPPNPHAVFLDLTAQLEETAEHWAQLGVEFDAIYSGFLGSAGQIAQIEGFFRRFRRPGTLVLVDPVMGDHGRPYRTYTPEMCGRMRELAAGGLRAWLERLSMDGRRSVVITGVSLRPGTTGAACFDRDTGGIHFAMAHQEPAHFSGTGDLFASVLLGALLRGEPLAAAAQRAASFVQHCAAYTLALGTPVLEGVQFEPLLGELMSAPPAMGTDVR